MTSSPYPNADLGHPGRSRSSPRVYYGVVENMRDIKGGRVELYEVLHAPYNVFLMGNHLGWSREADVGASAAHGFLKREVVGSAIEAFFKRYWANKPGTCCGFLTINRSKRKNSCSSTTTSAEVRSLFRM